MVSLAEMVRYTEGRIMENSLERATVIVSTAAATTFYVVGLPHHAAKIVAFGAGGLIIIEAGINILDAMRNNHHEKNN